MTGECTAIAVVLQNAAYHHGGAMPLIHWFAGLLSKLVPAASVSSTMSQTLVQWVATAAICLAPLGGFAWGEQLPETAATKGTIVAAGFGYQIGDTSTITVKVYDALSGAVLSDDTFELHVKEERGAGASGERIFAGGVGLGATDLSNFVLRVYDAKTGRFQWEGQLNLTPIDGGGPGQKVSTVSPRQATVTPIHSVETAMRQPSFLLRALDPSTGGLVWQDEFSADPDRAARTERIVHRLTNGGVPPSDVSHAFDFRIRMLDRSGRVVLWEDQFAQQDEEEEADESTDDRAAMLPAWQGQVLPLGSSQEI